MKKVKVNSPTVQSNIPEMISISRAELEKAMKQEITSFSAEAGLILIKSLIDDEVAQRCGKKFSHSEDDVHRYGGQQGWVTVAGQKQRIKKCVFHDNLTGHSTRT